MPSVARPPNIGRLAEASTGNGATMGNDDHPPGIEAPLSLLDETAIAAAQLRHDPYDFAFVDHAIAPGVKDRVLADAPSIPHGGSYGLPGLRYGPAFGAAIKDLLSPRFRHLVERKFDIDLSPYPPVIVMSGKASGRRGEGAAHTGSKHKIITVLVGFSPEWPHERGRLRVLRSASREDYTFEFAPEFGRMLLIRVGDHSWHGFLPHKGPRLSLQLSFVDSRRHVRWEYARHRVSAVAKSIPLLGKMIEGAAG